MYKTPTFNKSTIITNDSSEGSTIEQKIERIINNKEGITDGAPIIFTERNEGVLAAYNIKTDRFEVALEGIDKIQKSQAARREEKAKMEVIKNENPQQDSGTPESTQSTK